MGKTFDFTKLMQATGAVEVILDRPRRMVYALPAIQAFEEHFSMGVREWLASHVDGEGNAVSPKPEDLYYIVWLGLRDDDKELSLEKVQGYPWPVLNALYDGPLMAALVGYGALEGN